MATTDMSVLFSLAFLTSVTVTMSGAALPINLEHIAGLPFRNSSIDLLKVHELQDTLSAVISQEITLEILADTLQTSFHTGNSDTNTASCLADLSFLYKSLSTNGYQFIDAMGKMESGILKGDVLWTGDFKQCSEIAEIHNNVSDTSFHGKYMLISLLKDGKPLLGTTTISLGMCAPSSCGETDTPTLLNYFLGILAQNVTQLKNVSVVVPALGIESKPLDRGAKAFIAISAVLVTITLVSTIIDYCLTMWINQTESKNLNEETTEADYRAFDSGNQTGLLGEELFSSPHQKYAQSRDRCLKVVRVFSAYTNGKKLFGTETAVGPLACLNGIRVLSMWWVILGHTYAFVIYFSQNPLDALDIIKRLSFQPVLNGTFSVDSFFFLSGLLVAYLAVKQMKEKQSMNWAYYFLHRYWRLTPLYAFVIFYYAYISPYTVKGPYAAIVDAHVAPGQRSLQDGYDCCKDYWFTNLLYINNFYPSYGDLGKTCLGWGWYLANDMQFYIFIAPMMLIPIWISMTYLQNSRYAKWLRVAAVGIAIALIVQCIATRAGIVAYYDIRSFFQPGNKHKESKLGQHGPLYGRPYARWSVYVIGLLTGYLLAVKNNRIHIPRVVAVIGWVVAAGSALAVIYGVYDYNKNMGIDPLNSSAMMSKTAALFYISLSRPVWGLCLAWIVLASVADKGGPVNDILSWKIWAPLGRLTYAAYLIHPIIIFDYYLNQPSPIYINDLNLIFVFVGCLVFSYAIGLVVSLVVEAPMIQLEKALLNIKFGNSSLYARLRMRFRRT